MFHKTLEKEVNGHGFNDIIDEQAFPSVNALQALFPIH
jgi:hypothetical protein